METKHNGISFRALAKVLGVSATYIHDIENGRRLPSYELYQKMRKCGYFDKDFLDCFEVTTVKKVIPKWY